MVGSFGPYCIFEMPEGLFVRHERIVRIDSRGIARRKWTTINEQAVKSVDEAHAVIDLALAPAGSVQ
jgi:hypothetical protein